MWKSADQKRKVIDGGKLVQIKKPTSDKFFHVQLGTPGNLKGDGWTLGGVYVIGPGEQVVRSATFITKTQKRKS